VPIVSSSPWTFHPHPEVWAVNVLLLGAYVFAVGYLGPKKVPPGTSPASARQKLLFVAGVTVLWLGADWPIHDVAEDQLFSVHMMQHLLFMLVGPPLLLLGTPAWLWRALLGRGLRFRVLRFVTRPVPALLIFNGMVAFIHWPLIVEVQTTSETAHLAVHTLIVVSSLIMWWPVLTPLPETARLSEPGKMFFLFLQSIVPTVPASFLTFATAPIYAAYADIPGLWGIDPVTDQRMAGLIMKIGGGLLLWSVIAVMFFRWHASEEKQEATDVSWEDFERELEAWKLRK
jgi:putative membrane protein